MELVNLSLSKTKQIVVTALMALVTVHAIAEGDSNKTTPVSSLEINGYFDFYCQGSPQGHAAIPATPAGPTVLEGRLFDRNNNQMTMNMAEISLKKKSGKTSLRADLAFGEMVDQLSGGGSQSVAGANPVNTAANEPTRNITQAILTYAATDRLSLTAGKFYTHMGFEVTKAKENWQYSRSYTYNYGIPFWHQGLSGSYVIVPDQWAATLYLLNGWDGRISAETNKSSTLGASFNYTGLAGLSLNYNYIGGIESTDQSRREVHELNFSYPINPVFTVAADYAAGIQKNIPGVGDAKWSGLAFYLKAAISKSYSVSPRYEIFDDSDKGFALAGGLSTPSVVTQKVASWTFSNNFILDEGLEARFEIRSDRSDSRLYFKDKDGAGTDHQESYAAAVLYSF